MKQEFLENKERESTGENLDGRLEEVINSLNNPNLEKEAALELAADAVAIFPQHEGLIRQRFPYNETLSGIEMKSESPLAGDARMGEFARQISNFSELYPERTNEFRIPDEAREWVSDELQSALDDGYPVKFIQQARLYLKVFPNEVASILQSEQAQDILEKDVQRLMEARAKKKHWRELCDLSANISQIAPEYAHKEIIDENQNDISKALEKSIKQNKPEYYAGFARSAKELGLIERW